VKVKRFSKGMTQRLGLASALVHEPDVLLLDEPTDGVDPVGRREIRDLLREEAERGCAVLVNSHLLSEIEKTCGRVAILRRGKVVAEGRLADLAGRGAGLPRWKLVADGVDDALLSDFARVGEQLARRDGHFELSARDPRHLNDLVDHLRSRGVLLRELSPIGTSLEDVFVDLVQAPDRVPEPGVAPGERPALTEDPS
jgi:ABC-2 type transport system ATP-binding protein